MTDVYIYLYRYILTYGPSSYNSGCIQRGRRAATAPDPGRAVRWGAASERSRLPARDRATARVQAPPGAARGGPGGRAGGRAPADLPAEWPVPQADPRLAQELRAVVERAVRGAGRRVGGSQREGARR